MVVPQQGLHRQREIGTGAGLIARRTIEATGGHVGIADRLDLFQAKACTQVVECGKDLVEHAEDLFGAHVRGDQREIDQVGEHHRGLGKPIGDDFLPLLQTFGHRRRQDVEEQFLGTILGLQQLPMRFFEALLDLALLLYRITQQHIDDGCDRNEVEREEHHAGAERDGQLLGGINIGEQEIEDAGQRGEQHPGEEPDDRLAHAIAKNRPEWRQQPPEDDAAAGDEIADAPLHREGREEKQRELGEAEEVEIAGIDIEQQVAGQRELEQVGESDRKLGAERPINGHPKHRGDAHQAGGEEQQLFVERELRRIAGLDAGIAQPFQESRRGGGGKH